MGRGTDYGHPERAFLKNLELLGLGRHFGLKFFEAFGVFSVGLSAPILVLWVLCPCFYHYFYKKLSLYIQLPNIYLVVGFEFGSQRIWDLAFMCPKPPNPAGPRWEVRVDLSRNWISLKNHGFVPKIELTIIKSQALTCFTNQKSTFP